MKNIISKARGFTLIELLVVIAIIALLTGIVMTSLTGSKAKGRDAKRVSDLGQIQLALELYFDRCKEYPEALDDSGCTTNSGDSLELNDFISVIPKSPTGDDYGYFVNGEGTNYVLHVTLEKYNPALADDLDDINVAGAEIEDEMDDSNLSCEDDEDDLNYCITSN